MTDPDLLDALWLLAHPGWTWDALQRTPTEVIELMKKAERFRSDMVTT